MNTLLVFSRAIDRMTEFIGRAVIWLLLAAVVVSAVNAIVRYTLGISSNAWLELQWYLFSAVFLLGAGYVFLHDQHVRIDVISSRMSRRKQVWVDVIGIFFFLLPLCLFIVWTALPSLGKAIDTWEVSPSPGGLLRWPLFILLPIGFTLLFIQSISELIKRVAFLSGHGPDPHAKAEKTEEEKLLEEIQRELEEKEATQLAAAARAAKTGDKA
ncbi:TRAP transporter small permease subunit [Hydrogenophaga sp.]|uniref:TRAP transporter small permease subunit n=1 Tax=Hydrogenophaga sp. TaxID=1904254 RepID=UPI0019B1CE49|nr:TRAP transporter small permease subunit [Hydrogenophaga sp.]MBD3894189.1 TRAP transporter small permease subunit [Hydrogenophaga sp.]